MPHTTLSQLPLARYEVDRDAQSRLREGLIEQLWADPATRVLAVRGNRAPLRDRTALALLPPAAIRNPGLRLYLGRSLAPDAAEPPGTPIIAVEVGESELAELEWAGLRDVGHLLSDRDAGLLAEAVALRNWHDSHRFSPRTGAPTTIGRAGWARREPGFDRDLFPRTDPAVIVAVVDEHERLLMGSNALWEHNRFSLLAGFVEPGESLESAVQREVLEESGVSVVDVAYRGSQPWPFPASLMLGFTARVNPAIELNAAPDGTEILELRWFSRDELAAAEEVLLPAPVSIARRLIEEWFGGPLPGDRP